MKPDEIRITKIKGLVFFINYGPSSGMKKKEDQGSVRSGCLLNTVSDMIVFEYQIIGYL